MLEKIKSRLPGGIYFTSLMFTLKNILLGQFNIGERYILMNYFFGGVYTHKKIYNILKKYYFKEGIFNFYGIKIPSLDNLEYNNQIDLCLQFFDFIYPHFNSNFYSEIGEGPYEYEKVQINSNDIVIDAGANIGMFSVLASHLGATVYAFEPVKEIREKSLEITAKLNDKINVVPIALFNKAGYSEIEIDGKNLGGSSIILHRQNSTRETIPTITLDEWAKQNNIPRVDFIKADIEGAERLMLQGAQWVLKTYAPKLSICTYHLTDDKEVLTKLILQANPNYKIIHKWKKLYAWVEK